MVQTDTVAKQAQLNRKEIIKLTAIKIFAQYGYKETKTKIIATEANVSEGLIFRHFHSKSQLFAEIIELLMSQSHQNLRALQSFPGTPYQQIKALTEMMLDENHRYSFMIIQQARKSDAVPKEVTEILAKYPPDELLEMLVPFFEKGQREGVFAKGDPRKLLTWYFNIINSLTMQEPVDDQFGLPDTEMLMKFITQ